MLRLAVCYLDHRPPNFMMVIEGHELHLSRYFRLNLLKVYIKFDQMNILNVRRKIMKIRFGRGLDFTSKNYLSPTKP